MTNYKRKIEKDGVTIYLLYDEDERNEIEENICSRFPGMTKMVNKYAIKRELGDTELEKINLSEIDGYVFQGYNELIKELKRSE